jgi:ABC-type polysaccharide/polyol phosphate transport system ATPase subunit
VSVEGVSKTFRVPRHRVNTFKERALHPFRMDTYERFKALDDISFEIRDGEFFGIVGRNGSGKSTLLKLLASIYRADGGRIRVAGRLAPFIELGVGFNPELTARENAILNCVMMGFSQAEARDRFAEVIAFAELEDFADLKLKNFSSGMHVRLSFSLLMQSDADLLLIDEVLAVGDAAFQSKCHRAFRRLRDEGRTIIFVTHDMAAVRQYCHRAILLDRGRLVYAGSPDATARRYTRINAEVEPPGAYTDLPPGAKQTAPLRIEDVWVESQDGGRVRSARNGEPLRLCGVVEALEDLDTTTFSFEVGNAEGVSLFSVLVADERSPDGDLRAGQRALVRAEIENQLAAGGHFARLWASRTGADWDPLSSPNRTTTFEVIGGSGRVGVLSPPYTARVERQGARSEVLP